MTEFTRVHKDPKKSTELHQKTKRSPVILNDPGKLIKVIRSWASMNEKCIREEALLVYNP
jgi:hypothetical protein